MRAEEQSAYDEQVLTLCRSYATVNANLIARLTKRKYETARDSLRRLEYNGYLYQTKSGKITYYTVSTSGTSKRVVPDRKMQTPLQEQTNGVYVQAPWNDDLHRARTLLEMIPTKGFVCYPTVRASDVTREYIRAHHNGEYQIGIVSVGKMPNVYDFPESDIRIYWTKSKLNTNVSYNGKLYIPPDTRPYNIKTVSTSDGSCRILSVKVHPRYVYYADSIHTQHIEFCQQVMDIASILVRMGWEFTDQITMRGQPHQAINDPVLGSAVGLYRHSSDDKIEYDRSHGIPECEVISGNPDDVELMVQLPDIIRSVCASLKELTNTVSVTVATQSESIVNIAKTQQAIIQALYPTVPQKVTADTSAGMYQ